MAQITITIPDTILPRVINGFASAYGYSPILDDGTQNPETKNQFAKRKLIEIIKAAVKKAEIETATNAAAGAAGQDVDANINLS